MRIHMAFASYNFFVLKPKLSDFDRYHRFSHFLFWLVATNLSSIRKILWCRFEWWFSAGTGEGKARWRTLSKMGGTSSLLNLWQYFTHLLQPSAFCLPISKQASQWNETGHQYSRHLQVWPSCEVLSNTTQGRWNKASSTFKSESSVC